MILQLRLQKNLTVTEVADHLGISADQYLAIEAGTLLATPDMLTSLAGFYLPPGGDRKCDGTIIININSGTGSHSNSGFIHSYLNSSDTDMAQRLGALENLLKLVLTEIRTR